MNSNEFCFWLGGVVAATDREKPNDAQWAKILARLDSLGDKAVNQVIERQKVTGYGTDGRKNPFVLDDVPLKNVGYCGAPESGLPG